MDILNLNNIRVGVKITVKTKKKNNAKITNEGNKNRGWGIGIKI